MAQFSVNPIATINAAGSFSTSLEGYIQGNFLDDPAIRNWLAGGVLLTSETLPLWGGCAIFENVTPNPAGSPNRVLGGGIGRATAIANITGFSVFNQAHNMVNTPQSPVPLAASGMGVNFFRMGSGARIPVKCDPSLVSLDGGLINAQVSWDFNDQLLQPYVASGATIAVTSIAWAAGIGTVVAGAAVPFNLGDTVYVSGATNTGTGGNPAVNGAFVINGYTDSTHFTLAMPAAAGVIATIAGTILLNVGVGALSCKVLDIQVGNSMVVNYDPVTGFATWDRNGTTAVIQI